MTAIWNSVQAMPNSSMWWPLITGGLWCLYMLWPRVDGGNVPYGCYATVAPAWFSLGPVAAVWAAWAAIVAVAGNG